MKSDEASLKLTEKSGRVYYKAVPLDIATVDIAIYYKITEDPTA